MTKPDLSNIDKRIAEWHESLSPQPIHEYLGMTKAQYITWAINPNFFDETPQHEE